MEEIKEEGEKEDQREEGGEERGDPRGRKAEREEVFSKDRSGPPTSLETDKGRESQKGLLRKSREESC